MGIGRGESAGALELSALLLGDEGADGFLNALAVVGVECQFESDAEAVVPVVGFLDVDDLSDLPEASGLLIEIEAQPEVPSHGAGFFVLRVDEQTQSAGADVDERPGNRLTDAGCHGAVVIGFGHIGEGMPLIGTDGFLIGKCSGNRVEQDGFVSCADALEAKEPPILRGGGNDADGPTRWPGRLWID